MLIKLQEQIWAQHSHLHQRTKSHFYAKISGHDPTHLTNRVTVHSITKEMIEKTSNVTFLVNIEPRNLSASSVLCLNAREPRKHKNPLRVLPCPVTSNGSSAEFIIRMNSVNLDIKKCCIYLNSILNLITGRLLCFQFAAWSYAHKHLIFTVSSTPAGRHACIDNFMQRTIACV